MTRQVNSKSPGPPGHPLRRLAATLSLAVLVVLPVVAGSKVDFNRDIRPILSENCYACHGPDSGQRKAGLRLDLKEGALAKLKSGNFAIVPGHPERSSLVARITAKDEDDRMPPTKTDKHLSKAQMALLKRWIVEGAEWKPHWSFIKPERPPVPEVKNQRWPASPIDHFILARLEKEKLKPSPEADRATLLRRVTFDLLGLPPTPEELNAFLNDKSPRAWPNLIERLLASPRYGERWGRHWMDVVRYADTAGDNADYPIPEGHLYRDYIIDSFNADKPYDQFVREQLAGDILAGQGPHERFAEQVVATGFLALSRRYGTGPYELWHLTLENTIETVGSAFMGLSLRCARCHDHKYDPVTMRDYYGLYGIFASTEFPWAGSEEIQSKDFTRQKFVPLVPAAEAQPKLQAWQARLKPLHAEIEAFEKEKPDDKSEAEKHKRKLDALKKQLRNLEKPGVPPDLPAAYAVQEGKPMDLYIQLRGEPEDKGPMVPRQAPQFLAGDAPLNIPESASGRLEFARWLTQPDHPLTARVMANRLWQHHFGKGLVATPNNFGLRGEAPTHPELLDYLATQFVERGWSIKAMHRLILESRTYQLSSAADEANNRKDPANNFYWHFDRQRLDAEAIRDAMMFASGDLDLSRPGAQPFPPPEKWTWTQHTPFKERYESSHRSVYLMTQRFQRHPFLALFDGPDTNNSTETRRHSIVPQQALFALNNPFVEEQAGAFARRVIAAGGGEADRLRYAQELAWGRGPTRAELVRYQSWLQSARDLLIHSDGTANQREEQAWTSLARVLLTANEFLYVD